MIYIAQSYNEKFQVEANCLRGAKNQATRFFPKRKIELRLNGKVVAMKKAGKWRDFI